LLRGRANAATCAPAVQYPAANSRGFAVPLTVINRSAGSTSSRPVRRWPPRTSGSGKARSLASPRSCRPVTTGSVVAVTSGTGTRASTSARASMTGRRSVELLGHVPAQHADRRDPYDYAAEDVLVPQPPYAAQGWVSVVRPGPRTGDLLRRLVEEAHSAAVARWQRRRSGPPGTPDRRWPLAAG
jgi:hypothetical protein